MNKIIVRQYSNLLFTFITIAFNGLANALPLNGQSTGEISDRFQAFFVPAGYVFSIWGLIYLGLIAFAVYQVFPSQRENPQLKRLGGLFVLSCIANMAWLFLWHYEYFVGTVAVMLVLLTSLILIYNRLQIGNVKVNNIERWCVHIPFSIYLGWITVATLANISTVLQYLQWDGWGISKEIWTLVMLAVAAGITAVVSMKRGDVAYTLVIIWAFAGIAVKHAGVPLIAAGAWTATALAGGLLIVAAFVTRRRRQMINTA